MSDKELDLEPQLQLVEQEPKKNKLDDLAEQYNRLNAKCDIILEKIRNRKKKASNE
jgi:hypothetical protein